LTQAILHSLEDRLSRVEGRRTEEDRAAQILEIATRCGRLPELDPRTADEILGYQFDGTVR
jgi:hypothetical protein